MKPYRQAKQALLQIVENGSPHNLKSPGRIAIYLQRQMSNGGTGSKNAYRGSSRSTGIVRFIRDFIVRTNSGCVILVEVKGNYLSGSDAKDKMALGKRWEAAAALNFKYFMVFRNPEDEVADAMDFNQFLNTLECL